MKSQLLIRFNHAPEGVMDLFTSLLGSNNYVIAKTSCGKVSVLSKDKAAYVCLLARMRNNKIEYKEIKNVHSQKWDS